MKAIPLNKGYFAVVDDGDFLALSKYRWRIKRPKQVAYVICKRKIRGRTHHLSMHRVVLGLLKGMGIVHHKNGNGLDNRRCNLEVCTNQENSMSRSYKSPAASSRFKGVWLDHGLWCSEIMFKYKKYNLGRYATEVEAAQAYDKKAIELFGRFAVTNEDLRLYDL